MHRAGAVIAMLAAAGCAATLEPPPDMTPESVALADRFQAELQDRLQTALRQGGPVSAIDVCHKAAPEIAARLSRESGAEVWRIALRERNPAAGAQGEFREQLERLASAPLQADGSPATVRWVGQANGRRQLHFLRAIPMKDQPCALCHGSNVPPAVRERIAALYPNDRATGFIAGELRGAIAISWPVPD